IVYVVAVYLSIKGTCKIKTIESTRYGTGRIRNMIALYQDTIFRIQVDILAICICDGIIGYYTIAHQCSCATKRNTIVATGYSVVGNRDILTTTTISSR